jgi:hypothetical protein
MGLQLLDSQAYVFFLLSFTIVGCAEQNKVLAVSNVVPEGRGTKNPIAPAAGKK